MAATCVHEPFLSQQPYLWFCSFSTQGDEFNFTQALKCSEDARTSFSVMRPVPAKSMCNHLQHHEIPKHKTSCGNSKLAKATCPSAPALELLPFRVSSSGTERDLERTLANHSTTQKGPTQQTPRGKKEKTEWQNENDQNIVDITSWSNLIWDRIMR